MATSCHSARPLESLSNKNSDNKLPTVKLQTATMHNTVLVLILLLCSAVITSAQPAERKFQRYNYGKLSGKLTKRQEASPSFQAATGAPVILNDDGSMPVRKEIRELEKDKDTWTLYLLALEAMQNTDQTDPLSWYNIAGKPLFMSSLAVWFASFIDINEEFMAFLIGRHLRVTTSPSPMRTGASARTTLCSSFHGTALILPCTRLVVAK